MYVQYTLDVYVLESNHICYYVPNILKGLSGEIDTGQKYY